MTKHACTLKFGVKLPDTVIRWTLIKLSPYSIEVMFDTLWYKKKPKRFIS